MLDQESFCARVVQLLDIDSTIPVTPYDNLYAELGVDSLQAFQLIVIIEALADCAVPPLDIPEIYTLSDAYAYYRDLVAAGN